MDETPVMSVRRWWLVLAVLAGCLTLTACQAPLPDVTFYANRTAVATGPTRWCEVDVATDSGNCTETTVEEIPRLTIGPGMAVQINVPAEIGAWAVYFRYLNKDGELADGTSAAFTDGRLAYTLEPFDAQDQLVYVEVRSDLIITSGEQGGAEFGVWALLIDPEQPAAQDPNEQAPGEG